MRRKVRRRSLRTVLLLTVLAAAVVTALLIRLGVIKGGSGLFAPFRLPDAADADTAVRFIDVGQGDCTLAVSGDSALLIDSGETDERNRVISLIRDLGITRLDCVIVTHPHSDHMGEMADIIESFEVGRVIMPRLPQELTPTTYSYERLLKAIDKRNVPLDAADNESFELGGMSVTTYIPREYTEDLNNCSVVTRLECGGCSFLITGDCGKEEELDLIGQGFDLSAEVLRVGHHGSGSSSSEEFIAAVQPRYAVISCAADNDYGHPHEQTLRRLSASAEKIYITKDCGTVTFVPDGSSPKVYTERER